MDQAVTVEKIRVERDRIVVDVKMAPSARYSTPAVAKRLLTQAPGLAHHRCLSDGASPAEGEPGSFARVIENTSLPHVLEHLIIDCQIADPRTPAQARLQGFTEWTDEASGRARICVAFLDDLVALAALDRALALMNGALR